MKKSLLFFSVVLFSSFSFSQTIWNFSNSPFGANPTSLASTFTSNGLTVATNGTDIWAIDANAKTIDNVSYTYRLKSGGGGAPVAPSKIPTTRYLSINVSGNSEIKFGMISSSSSAVRTLIIVNEGETLLDSIVNVNGTTAATYTYNYSGGSTKLYFYSRASGINFYYVSATNAVITSVEDVFADLGIRFDGKTVINENNKDIEVYSVVGKLIGKTNQNFSMSSLPKGVYLVKAAGINGAYKFVL